MPRLIIFLVCCTLFHCELDAQVTPAILKTSALRRGIYKNYSEFLNNSPSVTDAFEISSRSKESKIIHGDASYHLLMPDSAVRRRDVKKLWGVCDGTNVYVNELPFTGNFTFRKMLGLGRYCFLMGSEPSSMPIIVPVAAPLAAAAGAAMVVGGSSISFGEMFYVLNINNGKFFPLTPKTVESIMEKEQKMLIEYQQRKRNGREEVMVEFIKMYNDSHLHEADAELWFGRDVVIYRRSKREFGETLRVTVNDTLDLDLDDNKIHQFQTDGESVKLCVDGECETIRLFRTGITYIRTHWKSKTSSPSFISVPPEDGKKDLKAITEPAN